MNNWLIGCSHCLWSSCWQSSCSSRWRPCVQPTMLHPQPGLPPSTTCCSQPGTRSREWPLLMLGLMCILTHCFTHEALSCSHSSSACECHSCCLILGRTIWSVLHCSVLTICKMMACTHCCLTARTVSMCSMDNRLAHQIKHVLSACTHVYMYNQTYSPSSRLHFSHKAEGWNLGSRALVFLAAVRQQIWPKVSAGGQPQK